MDRHPDEADAPVVGGVLVGLLAGATLGGVLSLAMGLTGGAGLIVLVGSSGGLAGVVFLVGVLAHHGTTRQRHHWR